MVNQMTQTRARDTGTDSLHLSVRIGGILHAIPIEFIEEILPVLPVEPIAQLPSFVRGIVFVRGHLIPILDGADRLGLPACSSAHEPHLVCLNLQGRLIGLEIDEAIELIELPRSGLVSMPELGGTSRFLSAVMDYRGEIVRILNPSQLLLQEEASQLSREFSTASPSLLSGAE